MATKDDVTLVTISLDIDEQPSLFILFAEEGLVNRMGNGSVDDIDRRLYFGKTQESEFQRFMERVPEEVFASPGWYTLPPEHKGKECKLALAFTLKDGQVTGIGFSYGSESIGPPPWVGDLVYHGVALSETWRRKYFPQPGDDEEE